MDDLSRRVLGKSGDLVMTYQITWREVNLGHMIVETEEEAQEFIQQPDMDDPRFTWKKKVYDINYVEMTTREDI